MNVQSNAELVGMIIKIVRQSLLISSKLCSSSRGFNLKSILEHYMLSLSRVEHSDGAFTGTGIEIFKC